MDSLDRQYANKRQNNNVYAQHNSKVQEYRSLYDSHETY